MHWIWELSLSRHMCCCSRAFHNSVSDESDPLNNLLWLGAKRPFRLSSSYIFTSLVHGCCSLGQEM